MGQWGLQSKNLGKAWQLGSSLNWADFNDENLGSFPQMASYRGCFLIEQFVIGLCIIGLLCGRKRFFNHIIFFWKIWAQMRTMRNQRISEIKSSTPCGNWSNGIDWARENGIEILENTNSDFTLFLSPDFICCSWLGAFNGAELVLSIQCLKKNLEGKGCSR